MRFWNRLRGKVALQHALWKLRRINNTDAIVLTFYMRDVPHLPALFGLEGQPVHFISLNAMRPDRGVSPSDYAAAAAQVRAAIHNKSCSTYVWGYYDKRFMGRDLRLDFPNIHRIENGIIVADARSRRYRRTFLIDQPDAYFCGYRATELENALNALVAQDAPRRPEDQLLLDHVIGHRVSKYVYDSPPDERPGPDDILIIGQVEGDASILETICLGKTAPELVALVHDHIVPAKPGARLFFKAHPRSHSIARDTALIRQNWPDVRIINPKSSVLECLVDKPAIATLTSGVGLEAALHGCEVHCLGLAFYAGWGFTKDYVACERRHNTLSAADVFLQIVRRHMRFVDPSLTRLVPLEQMLDRP
jgi:capsular polysaccharide export protein